MKERSEYMVTKDSKQYWKNIAAIPWSKRGEIRTKLVPWIYTNDQRFSDIYRKIEQYANLQVILPGTKAAVLSGVGSLLNIAPLPNVDFFVSVDRNSFVLDQVRRMVQNVQDAETREEYTQIDQRETLFTDLRAMGADPEPYWKSERESFGAFDFLASDDAYDRTRYALLQKPVYYTQGNFAYKPFVDALGFALEGASVTYASFTDLAEWSPEFLDTVNALPVAKDGIVVWSTNYGQPEGKPVARLSLGLHTYITDQRELLNGNAVSYFKPHV